MLSIRKPTSPPRTPVSHSATSSPLTTVGRGDGGGPIPKHGQFMLRAPHPSQASEMYYQEPHSTYDTDHYQSTCESLFLIKVLIKRKCCFLQEVQINVFFLLSSRFLLHIYSPFFTQTLPGSVPQILQCPRILSSTFHWPSTILLP